MFLILNTILKEVYKRNKSKAQQYWERKELPKSLSKIQSIFQWNEMSSSFKNMWVDYIESEFDKRELGYWFYNNGVKTYIKNKNEKTFWPCIRT